ncbi:MAG: transcription factor WhiB [Actinophytocola sp.]|nr:transcription factor WhiB [Actinophytocola sp.]
MQRPTTPPHPIRARRAGTGETPALALPGAWVRHAACGPETADLFFPISDTGPAAGDIARAKTICASCPVRRQCRDDAETTGQPHGVWGGLTDTERAAHHGTHRPADTPHSAAQTVLDEAVLDLIERRHTWAEITARLGCSPRDAERVRARWRTQQRRRESA